MVFHHGHFPSPTEKGQLLPVFREALADLHETANSEGYENPHDPRASPVPGYPPGWAQPSDRQFSLGSCFAPASEGIWQSSRFAIVPQRPPSTAGKAMPHEPRGDLPRLETLAVTLGGHTSRSWTEVVLAGPGAESRMLGAAFLEGSQHAEQWTVQDHQAPNTSSDLLYAGALNGTSRSVYHGTIRVQPGARGTNAYQSNRNLLLSSGSRANTNPQLEIQNEEVRCTHGATVGPIDPEQVFYLMARGIPRLEAERLLVLGFFDRVIQEGKWSGLEERLAHNIRARLNS